MPLQGRTREQLAVSVGYNIGVLYVSAASGTGSTTTVVDTTLRGGDDVHNGKWLRLTSGSNNDGLIRRVNDYVESTNTLTIEPAVTDSTANTNTYELWDPQWPPARLHDFIDQAMIAATGKVFDPEEDLSLHGGADVSRFDIPTQFAMLNRIDYRDSVVSKDIHLCNRTFDETEDGDITQALDTEDRRQGGQSLRLTIATGLGAGDKITDSITSTDISGYTHLEFWIKSTVPTTLGQLRLLLDDTAACASALETAYVPALAANTWTYARVELDNPEKDTAIISVAFEYTSDIGACTVWLDHLKATHNDKSTWRTLPKSMWRIDQQSRDLVLSAPGRSVAGYSLLKLVGGDNPALLSADSTATEIDDEYVIAKATELALESRGPDMTTSEAMTFYFSRIRAWHDRAERAMRQFPRFANVRMVT